MASIQTLPRPDYIKKHQTLPVNQKEESRPTKWDRIEELYRKVTDLVEVDRTNAGDEIFCRVLTNYAVSKGFSIKRFIVSKYGTWIVEEKLCYKGKIIEAMKLWEIELLFLEF